MDSRAHSVKSLSTDLLINVISDHLWHDRLESWAGEDGSFGVHVAVFSEPFLGYVLAGTKTVDSRFSKHRIAPYGDVAAGDMILIKQTSGPIVGVSSAERVWYYELDEKVLAEIKDRFGRYIRANSDFWRDRAERAYGTIILLKDVRPIVPFSIDKKDRRGWVTVKKSTIANPVVIAVAGPIGSGKTTISRALSKQLDCKHISFGDYFRQLAIESGQDPTDRRLLQRLGARYVRLSPERLCRDVLRNAKWRPKDGSLVIDGVRHKEVLEALRASVAPLRVSLVYIERDLARSTSALAQVGMENLALFDAHSTELQNDALRSAADVVVSGDDDVVGVLKSVLQAAGAETKP